ncbi:MAG: hypothetical protein H6706_17505 [Myxococcales bacterium]|nr:hypothetical protein [Myxococcales bacterium]
MRERTEDEQAERSQADQEQETTQEAEERDEARTQSEQEAQKAAAAKPPRWRRKARLPLRGFLQGLQAATRAAEAFQQAGVTLPREVFDQVSRFQLVRDREFTMSLRFDAQVAIGNEVLRFGSQLTGRIGDEAIENLTGVSLAGQSVTTLDKTAEGPTALLAGGDRRALNPLEGFDP